jgi:hypothetical protein
VGAAAGCRPCSGNRRAGLLRASTLQRCAAQPLMHSRGIIPFFLATTCLRVRRRSNTMRDSSVPAVVAGIYFHLGAAHVRELRLTPHSATYCGWCAHVSMQPVRCRASQFMVRAFQPARSSSPQMQILLPALQTLCGRRIGGCFTSQLAAPQSLSKPVMTEPHHSAAPQFMRVADCQHSAM